MDRNIQAGIVVVILIGATVGAYFLFIAPPGPAETDKIKIAFLLPGSINDFGWNTNTYQTANDIATSRDDVEVEIVEGLGQSNIDSTLVSFAQRGFDIIWCDTIGHQDSVLRVAPDYPDTTFVVVDAWDYSVDNIVGIMTPLYEGSYLAGILAAGVSQTQHIGFVDGQAFPGTISRAEAFRLGALTVNASIEVDRIWTGVWDDVTAGREATLSLIDDGVDVVLFHGDGVTLGGIQACAFRGVWAIGDNIDQSHIADDTVLTSNLYNKTVYMNNIIDLFIAGTLESKLYFWGMKDGGNDLAPFNPKLLSDIPQATQDAVADVRADIMSGAFEVPYIPEETVWP
jgi:basic membrane lipoprotein Med (substrate-binding protein (PBP1-ABC) superfamily)